MTETDSLQEKLGISFKDTTLLQQALVHRSYLNEAPEGFSLESNERLEFLGDAFLGLAVADKLYRDFPDFHEGNLTKLRSALVHLRPAREEARGEGGSGKGRAGR